MQDLAELVREEAKMKSCDNCDYLSVGMGRVRYQERLFKVTETIIKEWDCWENDMHFSTETRLPEECICDLWKEKVIKKVNTHNFRRLR